MKKLITISLALALLLTLAACGDGSGSKSAQTTDSSQARDDTPRSSGSNSNDTSAQSSESSGRINTRAEKYVYGLDFSDGVAWVLTEDRYWQCVDKTGKVALRLDDGETPASNFSNGVAVVSRADGTTELIDKSGRVISSPEQDGFDYINGIIHDLGMIVVSKRISTFDTAEQQMGVIDNNGNWVISLTADNFGLNNIGYTLSFLVNESSYDPNVGLMEVVPASGSLLPSILGHQQGYRGYLGEGIFHFSSGDYENVESSESCNFYLFNILTNDLWMYDQSNSRYGHDISNINNGRGVYIDRVLASIYSVDIRNHSVVKILDLPDYITTDLVYSDNLFLYANSSKAQQGFYDIDGKMQIDLSDYNIAENWSVSFENGYCLLPLTNPQGTNFVTVIDSNGNMLFEPIESYPFTIGSFSSGDQKIIGGSSINCGLIVTRVGSRNFTIINTSGEIIAEIDEVESVSNFREDVATVRHRVLPFIEEEGIYYIDKTGNRLF